ncbi:MAG: hypothetical protein J2P15_18225 [Micromonosporaceae bacterium]|nr:hypothetical protein [Micromonosporaceae bacterium]
MADDLNLMLEDVPDDVTALVREAAGSMPGYPGDLRATARRGAAKRLRYTGGMAGAAAVLALVAVAVPALIAVNRSGGATATPAGPVISWPQRQVLTMLHSRPGGSCGIGEVLPDGALRWIPVLPSVRKDVPLICLVVYRTQPTPSSQVWAFLSVVPAPHVLPDGRFFFAMGGPGHEQFAVVDADGTSGTTHTLKPGDSVIAADERDAFALRGHSVVAYDLRTGAARVLYSFPPDNQLRFSAQSDADIEAGRLAWVSGDCSAWVVDARTGTLVSHLDLAALTPNHRPAADTGTACDPGVLRLSPDGRRLAVLYTRGHPSAAGWIGVFDVASGELLGNVAVPQTSGPPQPMIGLASLAWFEPQKVRVAWSTGVASPLYRTYMMLVPEPAAPSPSPTSSPSPGGGPASPSAGPSQPSGQPSGQPSRLASPSGG